MCIRDSIYIEREREREILRQTDRQIEGQTEILRQTERENDREGSKTREGG